MRIKWLNHLNVTPVLLMVLLVVFVAAPAVAAQAPLEVAVTDDCIGEDGVIDVAISTTLVAAGGVVVTITVSPSEIPPRNVTLLAGLEHVERFSGRPDGVVEVTVAGGGYAAQQSTSVDCDSFASDVGSGIFDLIGCAISPIGCAQNVAGDLVEAVAQATGGAILDSLSEAAAEMFGWVLSASIGWWVLVPSFGAASGDSVTRLSGQFIWVSGAMVVLGIIVQGIRLIYTRSAEVFSEVLQSLFTISLVSGASWVFVEAFASASDEWARYLLVDAASDPGVITAVLATMAALPPMVTIFLGVLFFLASAVMSVAMLARVPALILMSAMLPFAASARLFGWGHAWLPRLANSLLALLLFKPIAAAMLATSLLMMGDGSILGFFVGATMLVLSPFVLPGLMKLFAFTGLTPGAGAGSGGGKAVVGAVGAGALVAHHRSGRSSGGGAVGAAAETASERTALSGGGAIGSALGAGSRVGAVAPVAAIAIQGASRVRHGVEARVGDGLDTSGGGS